MLIMGFRDRPPDPRSKRAEGQAQELRQGNLQLVAGEFGILGARRDVLERVRCPLVRLSAFGWYL